MPALLTAIFKDNQQLSDRVLANNMLLSAKGAANAYLTAYLESATPEIRAMYSSALNQVLSEHAALTQLAVNKKWYSPYQAPKKQLAETYAQSKELIGIEDLELAGAEKN